MSDLWSWASAHPYLATIIVIVLASTIFEGRHE